MTTWIVMVPVMTQVIPGRADTFAFAFFSFPELRHLTVFALTDSTVPQHTHAVIGPEGTVTPKIDFKVTKEGRSDQLRQKWVELLFVCPLNRCVVTTCRR